ncbi:MAG: thioredoxin-disulfide reductase [Planctomycetes bacterium]|nr:thioredoxin-disulfide reductase [Planctomycetota bacterium]MBI3846429.1 thioredoxin-disulfide reductase [Planctomycetota bacterium]
MATDARRVIIVGSGPAGYTAALYTSRANLKPLQFAGYQSGGQLMTTTDVENYPGFPEGIMGPDLMELFRKQAARFGTEMMDVDVTSVNFRKRPFEVEAEGKTHLANSVIISTGASAKLLGIDAEKKLMGHGVSTCATCDGAFFRNQVMIVVGGGDTAMEEANFLSRFASKLYVVHRRQEFRASKIMLDRAHANPKIEFVMDTVVEDVFADGDHKVRAAVLKNVKTGQKRELATKAVFVAIGHVPTSKIFEGQIDLDENGYIKVHDGTYTNVEGVFACGDVVDHVWRQAITAAGTGCMAAIDCERWLESQGH